MYKLLLNKGLHLKSFETAFPVFCSLSGSDEILKISLQGLPLQYDRANGGLQQLTQDMQHNFAQFCTVVDCGVVTNADDLFSRLGYVLLERSSASTSAPLLVLQHNVD
ncbi:MAG: hypothetical protein EXX96DRAFT_551938 [Benjaminiella poitrasii]|nr:MAG: hypothetical protein EXX96DRAFT_551938 [Benjaminiella poitrasii]